MTIDLHPNYVKTFKKRIASNPKLVEKVKERVILFLKNPDDFRLHRHNLVGSRKGLRSFSVAGDLRIIYLQVNSDRVMFLDIGSHNQVY